jgi:ABC-type dipeptide/oligopeptide/nickel transport system ATPase component
MKDNKIRRICFYGGAGCGKSTAAASTFAALKKAGKSVEFADEYIKFWTYIPRIPQGFDSLYVQAKQINKEDTILRSGTDIIVSDSPIFLQYFYAEHHNAPCKEQLLEIAIEFEKVYPSLNIVLERKDEDYDEHGRYETLQQAKDIDQEFEEYLNNLNIPHSVYPCRDTDVMISDILGAID